MSSKLHNKVLLAGVGYAVCVAPVANGMKFSELTGLDSIRVQELSDVYVEYEVNYQESGVTKYSEFVGKTFVAASLADGTFEEVNVAPMQPVAIEPAVQSKPVVADIRVSFADSELKVSPKSIQIEPAENQSLSFTGSEISVYVRDDSHLEYDEMSRTIRGLSTGKTELIFVKDSAIEIIPVQIGSDDQLFANSLQVPTDLTNIDIKADEKLAAAFPVVNTDGIETEIVVKSETAEEVVSIDSSRDQTETFVASSEFEGNFSFNIEERNIEYNRIAIQLVDERSDPSAGRLYPLSGVKVRIVGTEYEGTTDPTGHLVISDVPSDSRLMLNYEDQYGRVVPGVSVVQTNTGGVQRLTAFRDFAYSNFAQIAGVVPQAGLGSICVAAMFEAANYAGIAANMDVEGDGPFYFNRFGLLDRGADSTGPDGRVCFYNVAPGPAAFSFWNGDDLQGVFPVGVFSNKHVELKVDLAELITPRVVVAAVGGAHEQLTDNITIANRLTAIDSIDIGTFASDQLFAQSDFAKMNSVAPVLEADGRQILFSQAAEFEPTIYAADTEVVQLFPRGFIEDMSIFAQVSLNPSLGVVVAEHGSLNGQGGDAISFRLLTEDGNEVATAWYYSSGEISKAIFFNIPAGTYVLLAETGEKFWLATDVITVFDETLTYSRLGSQTKSSK